MPYTILVKKGCPWSSKALILLKKRDIPFVKIETSLHNGASMYDTGYTKLKKMYKTQTFPKIFDDSNKVIGGYSDLVNHLKKQ